MNSAVVFGGYGTFGAHVSRELARLGVPLVICGRNRARAGAFARQLGPPHRAGSADVDDPRACRALVRGQAVAVNCAGPFARFGPALVEACLEAACHYADIADDRRYVALVRGHGGRFAERRLAAVYGCSSLPAISGALGLAARARARSDPDRARVTLFIGNKNPKGGAALESLLRVLGQPIQAPQGMVRGFGHREVVPLPAPFGPRAVFNFESPEYDLFPALVGAGSVHVKVGFELGAATYALALMARLGLNYGRRTARLVQALGGCVRWAGTSGGAVMTELFFADGSARRATLLARTDGQRMAALPCALAVAALCAGTHRAEGAVTAFELLGARPLLDRLVAAGFELQFG